MTATMSTSTNGLGSRPGVDALKTLTPCPDWCEVKGHEHEADNHADDGLRHQKEVAGFVLMMTTADGSPEEWGAVSWRPEGDVEIYLSDGRAGLVARLRQISSDAAAAADWLEGVRR